MMHVRLGNAELFAGGMRILARWNRVLSGAPRSSLATRAIGAFGLYSTVRNLGRESRRLACDDPCPLGSEWDDGTTRMCASACVGVQQGMSRDQRGDCTRLDFLIAIPQR